MTKRQSLFIHAERICAGGTFCRKKRFFACYLFFMSFCVLLFTQQTAENRKNTDENGLQPFMESLAKTLKTGTTAEERLSAAETLAPLQEQIGLYAEAASVYGSAASLAGVQSVRGQKLLLGSVRCSLSFGDVSSADFLLSTAFVSATDANVKAFAKLYALWSWIIKAQNERELEGPISVLESYAALPEMSAVKPALLLTLYHITAEKSWASRLQNEFPDSPEAAVCTGEARLLPAPFWFFIRTNAGG